MGKKFSKKQLRDFGLLIGFGLPLLVGWLLPFITGHGFKAWTLLVGGAGLILGLIKPSLLKYPLQVWMIIGNVLGWVNSHIILGFVFIVILQPIAYIMRIFGYDPLRRRRKGEKTYRENRGHYKIDFTRIF